MNKQESQGFLDFVYNVDKLNMIFALSSVALVISMFWMVWDDYDREWKDLQRESMAMEQYKVEADLQAAQKEVDQDELKKIETEIAEVEASIQSQKARYEKARDALEDLKGAFYKADQDAKFEKAGYDVVKYEYEEAAHATRVSFDELIETSDIISCHVPLDRNTRGLLSTSEFERMKPTAIIINTCRGPVIDEAALIRALDAKQIKGAGIDVTEIEPIEAANDLKNRRNVFLTPHLAGISIEAREKALDWAIHNATHINS